MADISQHMEQSDDMMVFVSDSGFMSALQHFRDRQVLRLAGDSDLPALARDLGPIAMIEIEFPSSHDGRGFSLARALREVGFSGLIAARGRVIADQYRHLRQCGFDGVLLTVQQAARMPECHWTEQVPRISQSYQDRIFARNGTKTPMTSPSVTVAD